MLIIKYPIKLTYKINYYFFHQTKMKKKEKSDTKVFDIKFISLLLNLCQILQLYNIVKLYSNDNNTHMDI